MFSFRLFLHPHFFSEIQLFTIKRHKMPFFCCSASSARRLCCCSSSCYFSFMRSSSPSIMILLLILLLNVTTSAWANEDADPEISKSSSQFFRRAVKWINLPSGGGSLVSFGNAQFFQIFSQGC